MIRREFYLGEGTPKTLYAAQSIYDFCFKKIRLAGIQNGAKGLDLGCNQGIGLMTQAAQNFQILAADIDCLYVNEVRRNIPLCMAVVLDARDLPLSSGNLDFVFMHQVLEHIPQIDQSRAITEVARVLNPNHGIAFISTPNAGSRPRWTRPYSPDHRHELEKKEFIECLTDSFSKIDIYGERFLPPGVKGLAYQIARTSWLNEVYFNILPKQIRLYLRSILSDKQHSGEVREVFPGDNPRSILAICTKPLHTSSVT